MLNAYNAFLLRITKNMIPKELIQKIQQIEIRTNRMVNDVFAGEYHSVFKGYGMEFDEVREYGPGDDVRAIDWNVTARTGRPFIKKYVEERELTVMILVDVSSSGNFGTYQKTKNEYAAEIAALLAFSAIKNKDKVGLIIFTDKVEKYIPPKKGKKHVLRVIREILFFKPTGKKTNLSVPIQFLNSVIRRHSVSFIISDFIAADYKRAMQIANKRHDLIAVIMKDPREEEMPDIGIVSLEDAESGEMLMIDTADRNIRKGFSVLAQKKHAETLKLLRSINIDSIIVDTSKPYIRPFILFFKKRERKRLAHR